MKIAVPTRNHAVDEHFGHCESYTIFTVDASRKIEREETLDSPQGCGCKSNIAGTLHQIGVNVMLAGNMGTGALNVLKNQGISVYRGCSGDVHQVVEAFLSGHVEDSGIGCSQHEQLGSDHVCNH